MKDLSGDQHRSASGIMADISANLPGLVYRHFPGEGYTTFITSERLFRLCGYHPDEINLRHMLPLWQIVVEEDRARLADDLMNEPDGDGLFDLEYRIRHRDGSIRYISERGRRFQNSEGISFSDGIIWDVSVSRNRIHLPANLTEDLRHLVRNASVALAMVTDGLMTYVNTMAADGLGYQKEDLVGKSFVEIIHPDDRFMVESHYYQRLEGRNPPGNYEVRLLHRNGSIVWVEVASNLIHQGNRKTILSFFRDITQARQLRQALEESEEKLLALINATPDIICFKDAEGRWIQANESVLGLYRLKGVDYFNKTETELGEYTHEMYREAFINCGKSDELAWQKGSVSRTEELIPDATGTIRVYDVIKIPLFHPDKSRKGIVVIGRDITDRVNTEEALKTKTEEIDRFFSTSLDLLCIADMRGYFRRLNPEWEKTLGYSAEELTGIRFLDLVHPDDHRMTMEAMDSLGKIGELLDFVNRYRCKDGSYRYIEWRSYLQGELIYAVARDITNRKAFEDQIKQLNVVLEQKVAERTAQLEASNRELEAFAYSVSHDLRAPLRNINGFSTMLRDDLGGSLSGDAGHYIERIQSATRYMGQLIDDLLNLSKLSRRKITRTNLDLSAMVRSVCTELQSGEPGRKCQFRIENNVSVQADNNLVEIVLQNLLRNAWKFSSRKEETLIEFGSFNHLGNKAFFVRDHGAGFDMTYVSKLFIAFNRLHNPDEFEGSGIGLAIVNRIIRLHHGEIWAEASQGKGAVFYFTLSESPGQPSSD